MTKSLTSYDILNVSEGATQSEIDSAYRMLVKSWHPDRHHGENAARANHNFKVLQAAYKNLKTPQARDNYNRLLSRKRRAIMVDQNKVMNDNSPLKNFLSALDTIFNPIDRRG